MNEIMASALDLSFQQYLPASLSLFRPLHATKESLFSGTERLVKRASLSLAALCFLPCATSYDGLLDSGASYMYTYNWRKYYELHDTGLRTPPHNDSRNLQSDTRHAHNCLPRRKTSREYVMHAHHVCMFDR